MDMTFSKAAFLTGVSVLAMAGTPCFAAVRPILQSPHANAHRVSHKDSDRSLAVLYDQTSNDAGAGTISQAFDDFSSFDSYAADDFVVPEGQVWIVKEVDVTGTYSQGSGPANSEHVSFIKDNKAKLTKLIADIDGLDGQGDGGSFAIKLGKNGVKLKSGHYWLSVVVNMDFEPNGEWLWENQTTQEGDPAMWENPLDGFGTGCTTWAVESACTGTGLGDHVFVLKGRVK